MSEKLTDTEYTELDGAGVVYPYVATESWNSVYRIEAHLKVPVNPTVLSCAIDEMQQNYPYFFSTIQKSGRRFVLKKCRTGTDTVYSKDTALCKPFDLKSGKPLIRFLYSGSTLAVEFFHSLTDGHGAMEFTKTLLRNYRKMMGLEDPDMIPESNDFLQSTNDAFETIYEMGGKNVSRILPNAYHIKREKSVRMGYKIIDVPAKNMVDVAHRFGVSVAMLICALQIKAIAESQKDVHGNIAISVPVDLRKVFSLTSCRNTSLYLLVAVKAETANNFEQLLMAVKEQFKEKLTSENMRNMAYTNVSSVKLAVFRALPVGLKKAALKFGYSCLGENQFTSAMTDIGVIKFEEANDKIVKDIFFVLGKQKTNPINLSVSTFDSSAKIVISYDTECSKFIETLTDLIKTYTV